MQSDAGIGRWHRRPRTTPPLRSAAPSSLCRVRAEDRDLVAQRVAQIANVEGVAVLVPKARRALIGAASRKASSVKLTGHRVRRGLEGGHGAVANSRLLPV